MWLMMVGCLLVGIFLEPTEGFSTSRRFFRSTVSGAVVGSPVVLYTTESDGENTSLWSSPGSFMLETTTPSATPFSSSTRLYERIADQILDIVLTSPMSDEEYIIHSNSAVVTTTMEQQTNNNDNNDISDKNLSKQAMLQQKKRFLEFQNLLIEQMAKIMAASGKTLWSQARMRSGVLPRSGRTVLGAIVDPLGIFLQEQRRQQQRQSHPSKTNSSNSEDRSVVLTRQLIELIRDYSTDNGSTLLQMMKELPSELTRPQLAAFSRILSGKIWDRRVALVQASNRFWKQTVLLQAGRSTKSLAVASGESLLQGLPERKSTMREGEQPQRTIVETERLQAARNFLEYYQSEEAEERAIHSVKTTL
jgi:hypothetical protein